MVPKMSTPKLTAALKVSSSLQQRITNTLSKRFVANISHFIRLTRLNQEQTGNVPNSEGIQPLDETRTGADDLLSEGIYQSFTDAVSLLFPFRKTPVSGLN